MSFLCVLEAPRTKSPPFVPTKGGEKLVTLKYRRMLAQPFVLELEELAPTRLSGSNSFKSAGQ